MVKRCYNMHLSPQMCTIKASHSLLLDDGLQSAGGFWQRAADVRRRGCRGFWKGERFTGIFGLRFYRSQLFPPPLIPHLLFRQRQIEESWKEKQTKTSTFCNQNKIMLSKYLLTHGPFSTNIGSRQDVSQLDIGGNQVRVVLEKILVEIQV